MNHEELTRFRDEETAKIFVAALHKAYNTLGPDDVSGAYEDGYHVVYVRAALLPALDAFVGAFRYGIKAGVIRAAKEALSRAGEFPFNGLLLRPSHGRYFTLDGQDQYDDIEPAIRAALNRQVG